MASLDSKSDDINDLVSQFTSLTVSCNKVRDISNLSIEDVSDCRNHPAVPRNDIHFQNNLKNPFKPIVLCNIQTSENYLRTDSAENVTTDSCHTESNNASAIEKGEAVVRYYGLALSTPSERPEDLPFYVLDLKPVKEFQKQYPELRFKIFHSATEAEAFAKSCVPMVERSITLSEPELLFKSLKSQELVQFRKAITANDVKTVKGMARANPNYLIKHCEFPTILQEGARYHALHVAAKNCKVGVFRELLHILQDQKFYLLHSFCGPDILNARMKHLLDLYINGPDKAANETPLHMASKFGCLDIVQMLLKIPCCDTGLVDKCGKTALEVACSRATNPTESLVSSIQHAFKETYFVPLLRPVNDDACHPLVAAPLHVSEVFDSPNLTLKLEKPYVSAINAYAGPMTYETAARFYEMWSKPLVHSNFANDKEHSMYRMLGICDLRKGYERIGRIISQKLHVKWQEKWLSLKAFTNVASNSGLEVLEKRLAMNQNELNLLTGEKCEENSDDEDSFCTPPTSPTESPFHTPPEHFNFFNCFIEGCHWSESDVHLYNALQDFGNFEIDAGEFQHTARWVRALKETIDTEYRGRELTPITPIPEPNFKLGDLSRVRRKLFEMKTDMPVKNLKKEGEI